jgi:hypothetical protein
MAVNKPDNNGEELSRLSDKLFSRKASLDILWQTLAEQFYPERADFTLQRIDGSEFADHLVESIPAQNRRDLASAMGSMLRPRGQKWFMPKSRIPKKNTDNAKKWFEFIGEVQRQHLYRPLAQFRTAWQQGDDDFVSFGNAISALTEAHDRMGLFFETFHLRDCCWAEDRYHNVNVVHRKLKKDRRSIAERWGRDKLSQTDRDGLEKDPYHELDLRVTCMPLADYETTNYRLKKSNRGFNFVCVYYDPTQKIILEEVGYHEFPYLVRRWRTKSDSQYAYSPSAMLGLCDARLLQSQAQVILEAGEKIVDPPLVVTREAVLGDVNTYAGAITAIDARYDERSGAAIQALKTEGNIPIGLEMKQDTREVLHGAWMLNKLTLQNDEEMTAYETRERVAEYIRSATPIFEPFEADNAQTLDLQFRILMRITVELSKGGIEQGPFAPLSEIPEELQGVDVEYEFETPIQLAYRRQLALKAREIVEAVTPMAQIDPEVVDNFDLDAMSRDTSEAIGGKQTWLRDFELIQQRRQQRADEKAAAQEAQEAALAAKSVEGVAKASVPALDALKQLGQGGQGNPFGAGNVDPSMLANMEGLGMGGDEALL